MGRRAQTHERYEATLKAFREQPGNISYAARITNQAHHTVRDLWNKGWVDAKGERIPWAPPIKEAIAEEQVVARRMAARAAQVETGVPEAEVTREQERAAAIKTRTQEAQLCNISRGNVLAFMGVVNHCLRGSIKLAAAVQRALDKMADKPDVDPRVVLAMFNRLAFMTKMAHDAGLRTMEMERLRVGEPQAIFGLVPSQEMSNADALEILNHAKSVAERAEMLGLTVMDGGDQEEAHKATG